MWFVCVVWSLLREACSTVSAAVTLFPDITCCFLLREASIISLYLFSSIKMIRKEGKRVVTVELTLAEYVYFFYRSIGVMTNRTVEEAVADMLSKISEILSRSVEE